MEENIDFLLEVMESEGSAMRCFLSGLRYLKLQNESSFFAKKKGVKVGREFDCLGLSWRGVGLEIKLQLGQALCDFLIPTDVG